MRVVVFTRRFAYVRRDRSAGDVTPFIDVVLDGDLAQAQRIKALWALAHLPAFLETGRGPLACVVGQLLEHPSPLLAREAYEILCTLVTAPDVDVSVPELSLCVGKRNGHVVVSPRRFDACEVVSAHPPRSWCPDLDVEVRPLVDVGTLLDAASGNGFVTNANATDLLVLRAGHLTRQREHGPLIMRDASAPFVARRERNVWVAHARGALVVDGVIPVAGDPVELRGHHRVRWGRGEAHVVVVPALHVNHRVAIELPPGEAEGGGFDAVHEGDAWFSQLRHARGHFALRDGRVIVVDTTAHMPSVLELKAGDSGRFGLYDVELAPGGRVLRISLRWSDGPTRVTTAAAATKSDAKKKAA